jgi:hypothetical protein
VVTWGWGWYGWLGTGWGWILMCLHGGTKVVGVKAGLGSCPTVFAQYKSSKIQTWKRSFRTRCSHRVPRLYLTLCGLLECGMDGTWSPITFNHNVEFT